MLPNLFFSFFFFLFLLLSPSNAFLVAPLLSYMEQVFPFRSVCARLLCLCDRHVSPCNREIRFAKFPPLCSMTRVLTTLDSIVLIEFLLPWWFSTRPRCSIYFFIYFVLLLNLLSEIEFYQNRERYIIDRQTDTIKGMEVRVFVTNGELIV